MGSFVGFRGLFLALLLSSMNFAVSHSLASGKETPGFLRRGQLNDVVLNSHKSLMARDRTYQSNRTRLDSTWEDVTLFKIDRTVSEKENSTVGISVEIACVLCYIKGTVQATLKVPGDGDVVDIFVDYKKSVGDTIDNISTKAFGPVEKRLTQGAEEFLNATKVFEDRIESIAKKARDKVVDNLEIDTGMFESAVELVFNGMKKFVNDVITRLKETTTNFQSHVEEIANNAVDEIKNLLSEGKFIWKALGNLEEKLKNLAEDLLEVFKNGFGEVSSDLMEAFHLDSFEFPTIDIDFNLPDIDPIPDLTLSFALDDIELYLELEVTLAASATYTMSLFKSQSSLGIALPDAYAGAVVAIDLILTAEAEVQLQSGFHFKVDNSIVVDIGMFSQNISGTDFPGGQFEFLPVTVSAGNGKVMGVLRVELKAGIELQNHTVAIFDKRLDFGAGVEVSVFANVAQFVAEISVSSEGDDTECQLGLAFELNVGAAAGATLALGSHAWGPVPETSFSIYGATTKSLCEQASTSTLSATTSVVEVTTDGTQGQGALFLEDLETTTLSSTVIYTGHSCKSAGLVNCPASLQITRTSSSVITHITAIPSGETATFPPSSVNKIQRTVPFGSNMQSATSVSTTIGTSPSRPFFDREHGGVSNRIIVGVSIGLGVPVLILVVAALWLLHKRTERKKTQITTQ